MDTENKSHMEKTFEAFGYIALIAFVGAAILYPIIVFLEDNNLYFLSNQHDRVSSTLRSRYSNTA
ncbi:hypothetical protein KSF78_0002750 [Schistosoma japonicum]|nr:hypothetical protein KSF78_0002750 [Schistosoma japonicum]